jgi:1-deoxy-D-xylulose-5-phosphate reductoisomerase
VGGTAAAALNAANEVAVAAFLEGQAPFAAIPQTIQEVLEADAHPAARTLEDVTEADHRARERAREVLARRGSARTRSGAPAPLSL